MQPLIETEEIEEEPSSILLTGRAQLLLAAFPCHSSFQQSSPHILTHGHFQVLLLAAGDSHGSSTQPSLKFIHVLLGSRMIHHIYKIGIGLVIDL